MKEATIVRQAVDTAFVPSAIVEGSDDEELMRVTLASIGDAVISTDRAGLIKYMNPVAEQLTGRRLADVSGTPLEQSFRIVNELTRQPVEDPIKKVLRTGQMAALANHTVLIADGQLERPIDDSAAPIRNAGGEVIGAVLVFRDIAERRARDAITQRLAALVEHSQDAIYSTTLVGSTEGIIDHWNRGAERVFGYAATEIIGRPVKDLLPPDRLAEERVLIERLRNGEPIEPYETRRLAKDGHEVTVSITASPLTDATGRFVGISKIARDITARKRAEAALRESEEQFRMLADNIAQLAWMADAKGWIYWYNQRWYDYTGTTLEEMQGWGWMKAHHPDHVDRVVAKIQNSWDTGQPWEDTFPLRGKDGSYRWFLSRALPIRDAAGQIVRWLGTNTDVTEQHATEEALRRGALHDGLTDLPNRAYFLELLAQALGHMQRDPDYRIAVLLLDCDGFKAVNDTLGHMAGDRLLTEIGKRLRACVRPGDIVARLGGDEFTVLLEDSASLSDVEHAAQRIQDAIAAPLLLQDREILPSASIGAVLAVADHTQPQDLLRDADIAMYHAKQQGGGRFQVFDMALRDSALERLQLQTDLRHALERHEFGLLFQPIVGLETGELCGFEALLRWQRPNTGTLLPPDFVRLAEQMGVFQPIGDWVLREACRQASTWQGMSPGKIPLRLSVNLSATQLERPDIVENVREVLADTGLAPSCLTIEIPEHLLIEHLETSQSVLQRFQDLGVQILMDEFGAAYSSLTDPSLLPLQGIKIDRTLIHRMGGRRTDLNVVRLITDLAQSRRLAAIAVGIETVAQRERLIAFGCDAGQGYLFSRPLDAHAAARFAQQPAASVPH